MYSDSESDTKPDILDGTKITSINSLPDKSRKRYETVYKAFMDWRKLNNVNSFSENVLLAYFQELAEKYKSSSLWASYSMLRSTLNINHSANIETYAKLRAFLKRRSVGYQAKKAKRFTQEQFDRFIIRAPDHIYLATKVALIMGIMGACRASELHAMQIEDFQDLGSALLVTVPNTKTKAVRKFTITGHLYEICKKYMGLRPTSNASTSFFLNYQKGKCTAQNIGINKLGAMGKQIAKFLNLPDPQMYTGHNFRRLSDTLFLDVRATLERHAWNSALVAEGSVTKQVRILPKGAVLQPETMTHQVHILPAGEVLQPKPMSQLPLSPADDILQPKSINQVHILPTGQILKSKTANQVHLLPAGEILQPETVTNQVQKPADGIIHATDESASSHRPDTPSKNETINFDLKSTPSVHFTNCSNITINFITNKSDDPVDPLMSSDWNNP